MQNNGKLTKKLYAFSLKSVGMDIEDVKAKCILGMRMGTLVTVFELDFSSHMYKSSAITLGQSTRTISIQSNSETTRVGQLDFKLYP